MWSLHQSAQDRHLEGDRWQVTGDGLTGSGICFSITNSSVPPDWKVKLQKQWKNRDSMIFNEKQEWVKDKKSISGFSYKTWQDHWQTPIDDKEGDQLENDERNPDGHFNVTFSHFSSKFWTEFCSYPMCAQGLESKGSVLSDSWFWLRINALATARTDIASGLMVCKRYRQTGGRNRKTLCAAWGRCCLNGSVN